MHVRRMSRRTSSAAMTLGLALTLGAAPALRAQQMVTETRDPAQTQDPEFAKAYAQWTSDSIYGSPLVDHLPVVKGIPTPKDVLGYYIGAPAKLTYYADIVKYYRALAKATPRVKVETIGRSDEGRELVVVWVSSEENIKNLQHNRDNLAKLADPRGLSQAQINELIATTKPHYHLIGGLHSGETGPSEMLMELVYRLATETSPLITKIRDNVIVSVTPAAEPDGRDRNVDWFYHGLDMEAKYPPSADSARDSTGRGAGAGRGGAGGGFGRGGSVAGQLPYWGKYVYHDNNRDINLSMMEMRAITDWYYTAHPPIMHDLHESESLMYTYSGGPPQNPNLDPILFAELPWFSNWELAQMTKYGMPGVYTHAFMDGWSPGYLGSVAYNHNGMMRMYETQSGRDKPAPSATLAGNGRDSTAADSSKSDSTAASSARGGRGARGARGGRGGQGRGAAGGRGGEAGAARGGRGAAPTSGRGAAAGRGAEIPTGKGGGQPREWYRGLPIPPNAIQNFTRRNNTNYMETGVLSALQLTAMFPNVILQNFYIKTKHSLEDGSTKAPYGFVLPKSPDMTRAATLVNILRAQGIEVGTLEKTTIAGDDTFPAGSYVVKLNQPYGRLAKNLLERQDYPDPALMTYDDSGWSMGYAFDVVVKEINEKSILDAPVTPIMTAVVHGTVTGSGSAGLAVAHYGSNNMIAFRYRLKNVPMKIAEASFTADGVTFPAGSFIISGSGNARAARAMVDSLGLTAVALSSLPTVKSHDADVPRVAIYSQWNGTQDLGWYRYTFDHYGIPYDLIYKERLEKGDLHKDYDVILMAAQNINRSAVLAPKAKHPQPYEQSDKYKFLGMYGSTPDMSGGFGAAGVDAINAFLDAGGTLITAAQAIHYPIDFGLARSVEAENPTGVNAQKPLIMAKITRRDSPVFYGYDSTDFPLKFGQGSQIFHVGVADQPNVIAEYVGGESSVLSGLMVGADNLKDAAFAVDIPQAHNGHGRVLMFANNPIYRWQNHGEFNMVFNSILNWDDVPPAPPLTAPVAATGRGRGGQR